MPPVLEAQARADANGHYRTVIPPRRRPASSPAGRWRARAKLGTMPRVAARYEVIRTEDPLETHLLVDHEAKARVVLAPTRGGMVTRFIVSDTNVLYLDADTLRDPTKNVRGGIPVLFPIAGRLADDKYRVDGATYTMKQHGFARNMPWAIVDQATDGGARLGLALTPTAMTRAQYPFEFRLAMTYVLSEGRLTVQTRVSNLGERPMPIAPGLHPYFQLADHNKARGARRDRRDAGLGQPHRRRSSRCASPSISRPTSSTCTCSTTGRARCGSRAPRIATSSCRSASPTASSSCGPSAGATSCASSRGRRAPTPSTTARRRSVPPGGTHETQLHDRRRLASRDAATRARDWFFARNSSTLVGTSRSKHALASSLLRLFLCAGLLAVACGRSDLDLGPPTTSP